MSIRGGHWHWQVGRMPNTDLIPDLRLKGVKDLFFLNPRAKIVPSTVIVVDHCRSRYLGVDFYTFNVTKTSGPITRLFQRSKVVSNNLSILPFLKFEIWKFLQVLMPTSASGCWREATWVTGETCVYLSVRNCPRRGRGGREVWNFLSPIKKFFTKILKYGYRSCPPPRLSSITTSMDRFNVKKHRALYLDFSKAFTARSYPFFEVNDVDDMSCWR